MAGYCPLLERVQQHDQSAGRQVGTVGNRAFHRAPPDDDADRDQPGQEHAVEHRRERIRSEERRVGKECRSRWTPDQEKKKEKRMTKRDKTLKHKQTSETKLL